MPAHGIKVSHARSEASAMSDGGGGDDDDDDDQRDTESAADAEGSVSRRRSAGDGGGSRRSRSRVHFSCTECHRRKQKCNRQTPCQHCIARKIPDRCKTFQPGEDPNDLGARVSRIERTMHDNFDRLFAMLQHGETARLPTAAAVASSVPDGVANWRAQTTAAGTPAAASSAVRPEAVNPSEGSEAGDEVDAPIAGQVGTVRGNMTARVNSLITDSIDHRTGRMADPLVLTDPMNHIEQAAQLDVVMHEYGATYSVSQVLMASLPPREVCDALVGHFFETHNWLRQPMSRRRLMRVYEAFWRSGGTLTVNNINVYSTFMMTAAIGALTYRGPYQVSDNPRVIHLTAKRLFFAARQGLLISVMLGREEIQQVVAFHLASRYLFLDRRISEAWSCVSNAIKTALSIGLHRDGSLLNLPEEESEARRRIWSIIYFAERVLCMNLGRPSAIDDNSVDTHAISDRDEVGDFDEYMKELPGAVIPPGERPRFLTHTLFRNRLAVIMGKTIAIYQNVQHPAHYSDVVSIEHSLEALHKSYPDHLRSEFDAAGELRHVNTAWDSVYEFVPAHRYQQQAELLFVRMSLHRPYLIRPTTSGKRSGGASSSTKGNQHRYNLSRRACIEAAYQTLMLRKNLSDIIHARLKEGESAPAWLSHLGTSNTLSAIVVLGIYLLMEPHADNAEMMLRPLRLFHEAFLNKWQRAHQFNDVKEREFTILRMFLERIDQARSSRRDGTAKRQRDDGKSEQDKRIRRDKDLLDEAPSQHSKEADTAGALLHLNQVGVHRSSAPEQTYAAFAGPKGGNGSAVPTYGGPTTDKSFAGTTCATDANDGAADDGTLPWPYLPIRTPHHPGTTTNGLSSSPHTMNSSGSASHSTPPPLQSQTSGGNGKSNARMGSIDDAMQDGASVHQLFDSWFRYNAFENLDMGMNTNDGIGRGANAAADSDDFDASKMSAMFNADGTGTQSSWPATSAPTPAAASQPTAHTGGGSGATVHWSTLPTPTHAAGGSTKQAVDGAGTAAGFSNADFDSALMGMGIPPGPRDSFVDATNQSTAGTDGQLGAPSLNAASYDPTFWQSLMDKISG